uniref:Phosphohexomutase n=1 Tax=Heterorhabditis bacteriophora TaxID=37862 RepID=A0A1I7WQI8_HETBA
MELLSVFCVKWQNVKVNKGQFGAMKRLQCTVKTYDWGKMGNKSEVARLFAAGHKEFRIEDDTSYAELWMGTHPDGPAVLEGSYVRLSSFIAKSQSVSNLNKKEDIHLPFIMKVMSIRKTLSLQVHPTKEQAARLHARDPIHYPDKHHKPELAYALTRFELLSVSDQGYLDVPFGPSRWKIIPRDQARVVTLFSAFPSLTVLLDKKNCSRLTALILAGEKPRSVKCREALAWCFGYETIVFHNYIKLIYSFISFINMLVTQKKFLRMLSYYIVFSIIFRHMMEMSRDYPSRVEELVEELLEQLDKGARGSLTEDTVGVIRKMAVDFPGDVGIFSPLLLNHMILQPGECCYYAAEELHAYLSGGKIILISIFRIFYEFHLLKLFLGIINNSPGDSRQPQRYTRRYYLHSTRAKVKTIPAEAMHKPVFAIESDNEEWVFEVESEMDGFI